MSAPTLDRFAKWIPVGTRLPHPGQDVLAWCGWCITARYKHPRARKPAHPWHTEDGSNPIFMVSHWMLLPKAPRQGTSGWLKIAYQLKKKKK